MLDLMAAKRDSQPDTLDVQFHVLQRNIDQ